MKIKASHRRYRPATSDVELRQLRAFVAVAENASVTEASRVLGVTSFSRGSTDIVVPVVPLVAFALPSHPLARSQRRLVPRNTIVEFPVFVSDSAGDFKVLLERFFRGDGLPAARLQPTGTIEGVKKSVIATERAIGILPAYTISNELRSGRVVRLDVRPTLPTMSIVAVLSKSRQRHPSIEEVVNGVRAVFTEGVSD